MVFAVFGRFPWVPGRLSYLPGPILGFAFLWRCICRQKYLCSAGAGFLSPETMDVTKPFRFTGVGAMDVTETYKLKGFGAMDCTKPYIFPNSVSLEGSSSGKSESFR